MKRSLHRNFNGLAQFYLESEQWEDAEESLERALNWMDSKGRPEDEEEHPEDESKETFATLRQLAIVYRKLGRYSKLSSVQRRLLRDHNRL